MEMTRREALTAMAGLVVVPTLVPGKKTRITAINPWEQAYMDRLPIVERWRPTGLLDIPRIKGDILSEIDLAVALENQRLFNEVKDDGEGMMACKRMSLPIIGRFWGDWIGRQMFNTWSMLGPDTTIFHQNEIPDKEVVKAGALILKSGVTYDEELLPDHKDIEQVVIIITAALAAEELLAYAFAAIEKNCPVFNPGGGYTNRTMALATLQFYGQCKEMPDWLACDQETCEALGIPVKADPAFPTCPSTRFVGTWGPDNRIEVFCRPWKCNPVFGRKQTYFDSGYTLAMYVPLAFTEPVITGSFCPRRKILCRFGHRITNARKFLTVQR